MRYGLADCYRLATHGRWLAHHPELQRGLKRIHQHGCVIKDLGQGLVDFYALNGDRLIFLCWKLGEPEVSHWHALDGGFATRRPVPRGDAA